MVVFFLVYQQFEGSVLQPIIYSRAVHLDGLTIFIAVLAGGCYWSYLERCWLSR